MRIRSNRRRVAGFTLTEVMVASVIFLGGVAAALQAIGAAESQRGDNNRRRDATFIAEQVVARLRSMGTNSCPGGYSISTDLLADPSGGAPTDAELTCFGTDAAGLGSCQPDYPRSTFGTADLDFVIGGLAAGAGELVWRTWATAPVPQVVYRNNPFRVTWNAACDLPLPGSKTVRVTVGWGDLTDAIDDGRYVAVEFIRGLSL